MSDRWSALAVVYLVMSIVGLAGTWIWNVIAITQGRDYLGDWINSGPSVSSLTVDVLVAAVVAGVLIVVEGRRVGMRHLWVYIVLIPAVALAFALPLFLAMRERALARRATVMTGSNPHEDG